MSLASKTSVTGSPGADRGENKSIGKQEQAEVLAGGAYNQVYTRGRANAVHIAFT
jgi:hypothetical protein